jgi:hypothetical protein
MRLGKLMDHCALKAEQRKTNQDLGLKQFTDVNKNMLFFYSFEQKAVLIPNPI